MRSAKILGAAALLFALLGGGLVRAEADEPCALPASDRLAGEEPSGMGGTGVEPGTRSDQLAGEEPSGMGGTGAEEGTLSGLLAGGDDDGGMGGTGIVGTITGFGSICVNGLRITYGPDTPTERNGVAATSDQLAIGDVVNVLAQTNPETGALRASSIGVRELVRGPLESAPSADARSAALVVLGQQVVLPAEWDPDLLAELMRGDYVAVSGQRRGDGSILASRVALIEGRDSASLIGTLEVQEDGSAHVAGVVVELEASAAAQLAGEYVVATGAWDDEARSLRSAEIERAVPFDAETASTISVGGYVEDRDASGVRVGGIRVEASRATFQRLDTVGLDDYIVIRAVVTASGAIRAVRIAHDVRPPRAMIPRPPRIKRVDHPSRLRRYRLQRPPVPPRPPRVHRMPRPVRILKRISG